MLIQETSQVCVKLDRIRGEPLGSLLTALAMAAGGGTSGDQIREGFYKINEYKGLIKTYSKPFSEQNHDALTARDYVMVAYEGSQIVPVK